MVHITVLDLKDTFFTILLHPQSQILFAFIWEDFNTLSAQQWTWIILSMASETFSNTWGSPAMGSYAVLQKIVSDTYHFNPKPSEASKDKAQIYQITVSYLSLSLLHQTQSTSPNTYTPIKTLLNYLTATIKRVLLSLLGLFNFSPIWTPNFSLTTQPHMRLLKALWRNLSSITPH